MITFLFLGYKAFLVVPFVVVDYLLISGTIDLIKKIIKKRKSLPE